MIQRSVAETYTNIGDFDAALELLGFRAPPELIAETLFRAKRFRELSVMLRKVKAPRVAAKVAWYVVAVCEEMKLQTPHL